MPYGAAALRQLLILAFVIAFFVLHLIIADKVRKAAPGVVPDIDDGLLAAATATAGVLGSGFALAMGLEKKENPRNLLGPTAFPKIDTGRLIVTLGVWGYAAMGAILLAVWVLNEKESPEAVKGMAVGFVGYVVSLATSFFGAIRPN